MKTASLSPDTEKQQRFNWHLQHAGYPHGWRQWLVEQRARGLSAQNIAYRIRQETGLSLDQSTVNLWIKQAQSRVLSEGQETIAAASR